MSPLIDIPRVPLEFPERQPKYPIEIHLEKISKKIKNAWGTQHSVFIDLFDIDLSERTSSGIHPLECISNYLSNEGIRAIFTTGLDRDTDFNKELGRILSDSSKEVCFRLMDDDLDLIDDLEDELEELMDELLISTDDVHLLLDFRDIRREKVKQIVNKTTDFINHGNKILEWKSVIIAGSSFPDSLAKISQDSELRVPRIEFAIWKFLVRNSANLKRVPAVGDYGVVCPNMPELDPRAINPSAKIRYTLENDWLILKGHSLKQFPGYKQYHSLSLDLSQKHDFLGGGFCWGDQYIVDCGQRNVGSGNLTTWVKVDTNHHLKYVSEQIANYV